MLCDHYKICSGCSWIEIPWDIQISRKEDSFWKSWESADLTKPLEFSFRAVSTSQIRDRSDLVYQDNLLSLYQKESHTTFEMSKCPQMSESLQQWFSEFKKFKIPIKKGSLRLRVSPTGKTGVWLDFANQDIKELFDEKNLLLSLLEKTYVEIGQRRKKLYFDGERLRLGDPEYHQWTETYSHGNRIPLYSLVASFSQAGHSANKVLVEEIERMADKTSSENWAEFGAGSGNLTFPLSGGKRKVLALEYDELSLAGLEKTLNENQQYKTLISVNAGDFQRKKQVSFTEFDGVLVNPPRSGLVNFLDPLKSLSLSERPQNFLYMSCYKDSFVADSKNLQALGYKPQQITLVDQFPQSPHFEILSSWKMG